MKHSKSTIAALCILASTSIVVSQTGNAQNMQSGMDGLNPEKNMNANPQAISQDGKIIAFIAAIDNQEIAAANTLTGKNVTKDVSDYAKMMKEDHGKNLSEALDLSKSLNIPENQTQEVKNFKTKGQGELRSLSSLNNHPLDVAYINAMVEGHTKVLSLLNGFSQEAKSPALKEFIMKTHGTVEKHLDAAKKVQADLKNTK